MRLPALLLAAAVTLAACTPSADEAAAPAAAAAASEARANEALELYRQMLAEDAPELAAPIGEEIVRDYPDSEAAAEVRTSLDGVRERGEAETIRRRLAGLWSYQQDRLDHGAQSTASIYAEGAGGNDRVRLILRRHSEWGFSVYLYEGGKGFDCRTPCRVPVKVDGGEAEPLKAYLPPTGEPALMFEDEDGFMEILRRARTLDLDVLLAEGGPRTLHFEVGGFDPERFLPLDGG